jgi:hypothetical protein
MSWTLNKDTGVLSEKTVANPAGQPQVKCQAKENYVYISLQLDARCGSVPLYVYQ